MGKIRHQLHPDSQEALEGNILDKNGQRSGRQPFSDHDVKGDLWIDLVLYLLFGHFGGVVGSETYPPIHHDDIILCPGEGPDFIYPRSLIAKSQVWQPQGIKKSRGVLAQDLIDSGFDSGGQNRLVDAPKTVEKVV